MPPLWGRVYLGAMLMKRYFAFFQPPALLEPHHQIVFVISRTLVEVRSLIPLLKYTTDPVDWDLHAVVKIQF